MNAFSLAAALSVVVLTTACRQPQQQQQQPKPSAAATAAVTWNVKVDPLPLPAAAGSTEPQLTASDRGVVLSWIEQAAGTATLKFAERNGSSWSTPQKVAAGKDWFVSWADVPGVMRMADGTLVANWYRSTQVELEAYDLWLSHSSDDGRTWAKPFTPHHERTKTQHGFASLFELPSGLGLVWLDAREWELAKDDPQGGSVMLRYATYDRNWKQTAEAPLNLRVCDCCQTAVAATTDGIVTAFRDRSEKEIRDIAVTRFEHGAWSDTRTVHDDNWEIDSCPVNGPALGASGRNLAAAWFTAKGDQGKAFAAFSSDAGRTWGEPIRLDDGKSLGHVDIEMLDGSTAVATWVEFADQRGRFRMRRIDASGGKSAAIEIAGSGEGRVSGYPRMARHGDELVFAWTESSGAEEGTGMQQVKAAVARVQK
jgi:hypothetical protein